MLHFYAVSRTIQLCSFWDVGLCCPLLQGRLKKLFLILLSFIKAALPKRRLYGLTIKGQDDRDPGSNPHVAMEMMLDQSVLVNLACLIWLLRS